MAHRTVVPAFRGRRELSTERRFVVDGGADDGAGRFVQLRRAEPRDVALLVARVPRAADCARPVAVELYGASSSADAEFTATLVDIGPDLTGAVIASATGRAAVDAAHIAIELGDLEHTLATAHRLRVDIGAASSAGLAAQQVFHDAVRPSCVVLPAE